MKCMPFSKPSALPLMFFSIPVMVVSCCSVSLTLYTARPVKNSSLNYCRPRNRKCNISTSYTISRYQTATCQIILRSIQICDVFLGIRWYCSILLLLCVYIPLEDSKHSPDDHFLLALFSSISGSRFL